MRVDGRTARVTDKAVDEAKNSKGQSEAGQTESDRSQWRYALLIPSWLLLVWSLICMMGSTYRDWPVAGLPAWWTMIFIMVMIHEAGHAVATLLSGWRVAIFAVGPIGYHVVNRDFAWIKKKEREEYAGYVLPFPSGPEVWTRRRKQLITIAGPLANLLTAAILFGLYFGPVDWPTGGRSDPQLFTFGSALLSLSLAIGSTTDFENLLRRPRTSSEERERYGSFMLSRGLLDYQVRLRDLPGWMIDDMKSKAVGIRDFEEAVNAIVVGIALDSLPQTVGVIRSMLEDHRARFGNSVWLDDCDAYFSTIWERDAKRARSLLTKTVRPAGQKSLGYAAKAAVLAREGDRTMANVVLDKMRQSVRADSPFPNHTFIDIERQILMAIELNTDL